MSSITKLDRKSGSVHRKVGKLVAIMFFYSIAAIAYPSIRFHNNWINKDFNHIAPKLAEVIDPATSLSGSMFGNSLLYPVLFLETHQITGLDISGILLFAFPLTVGMIVYLVLINFTRTLIPRVQWGIAACAIAISPLLLNLRTAGKHSPFTYTIFFLAIGLILQPQSQRKRLLLSIFAFSLILYHYQITILFIAVVLGYAFVKVFARWNVRKGLLPGFGSFIAASIVGWFTYLFYSRHSLSRFISYFAPPYPTTTSGYSSSISGSKQGSGLAQYVDVLTLRWEPWWIFFILSFPMFLYLVSGGVTWIVASWRIFNRRTSIDDTYILATIMGLIGIPVFSMSLGGLSATNLMFRYLLYFLPVAIVFVAKRCDFSLVKSSRIVVILAVLVLMSGMIVAPVKVSREPSFQEVRFNLYDDELHQTLSWTKEYSSKPASVPYKGAAQAVFQLEFDDHRAFEELPITVRESNPEIIRSASDDRIIKNTIYTTGKVDVISRSNRTNQ